MLFPATLRWVKGKARAHGALLRFELPISGEHVVAVAARPALHRDPFDRLRVAQAQVEGITLLTCDPHVAAYPGPVRTL